jgi:hypothetical protein
VSGNVGVIQGINSVLEGIRLDVALLYLVDVSAGVLKGEFDVSIVGVFAGMQDIRRIIPAGTIRIHSLLREDFKTIPQADADKQSTEFKRVRFLVLA